MFLVNLLQRGYVTSTVILIALVITLHSDQVAASTQTCETYFGPGKDPQRYYCSRENIRYSCAFDSCKEGGKPWSSFYFQNCFLIKNNKPITTKPKDKVYPIQYHSRDEGFGGTIRAQDRKTRAWYSCTYEPYTLNSHRPSANNG
ncbi:hypothetical protein PGT21_016443 [Puccinia graminis f. sp. tritici]|uniref:Secreted protein n=1 Tax=Puccinia graminis f. sp. tritici TaxID=56615 RepID=A0A5B0RY61_PUCGR|nr:hypothetical protein PGT21_016443 [Puccinia graminis f. sp. tritici]KAA1078670.1 hypothetical protein PGTUg99_010508 [Puccinia graminis f. sp. tritici]KAA1130517.1 hypothetical protein PGTUg99_014687 [Puccinia graminis f. sp. tritici]